MPTVLFANLDTIKKKMIKPALIVKWIITISTQIIKIVWNVIVLVLHAMKLGQINAQVVIQGIILEVLINLAKFVYQIALNVLKVSVNNAQIPIPFLKLLNSVSFVRVLLDIIKLAKIVIFAIQIAIIVLVEMIMIAFNVKIIQNNWERITINVWYVQINQDFIQIIFIVRSVMLIVKNVKVHLILIALLVKLVHI